jgi:hypothetical protein
MWCGGGGAVEDLGLSLTACELVEGAGEGSHGAQQVRQEDVAFTTLSIQCFFSNVKFSYIDSLKINSDNCYYWAN